MERQTLFGEIVPAYRWYAHRMLPQEEADRLVRRVLEARPDLWQAWSAWIDQLRETDRLAEAREAAERARGRVLALCGQFPDGVPPELLKLVLPADLAHGSDADTCRAT